MKIYSIITLLVFSLISLSQALSAPFITINDPSDAINYSSQFENAILETESYEEPSRGGDHHPDEIVAEEDCVGYEDGRCLSEGPKSEKGGDDEKFADLDDTNESNKSKPEGGPAECRPNYNSPIFDCSQQARKDAAIRDQMQSAFETAQRSCNIHMDKANSSTCRSSENTSDGGGKSGSQASCSNVNSIQSAISPIQSAVNSCQGASSSCASICNINITNPDTYFSSLVASNGPICESQFRTPIQKLSAELSELRSSQSVAQQGCEKLSNKTTSTTAANTPAPAPTTTASDNTNQPPPPVPATSPDPELGSGGGGGLLSGLAGLAGGLLNKDEQPSTTPTPELRPSASLPFNNAQFSGGALSKTGVDLSGRGGARDDLADDSVLRDQNNNNAQFNRGAIANAANGVPPIGGGNTRAQVGAGGAGGGFGGTGGPRRNSRGTASSVKTRNIISGYKKVKPSDGGGSLSIRPNAFKKFGKAKLKTKLTDARKKFGKDVPLIFKNGKFVMDFLAMKEKKGFKSRQAAMEGYWKGKRTPSTSSQACNPDECHQNEKLNLFKIMNFRFQKEFSNVKIDI